MKGRDIKDLMHFISLGKQAMRASEEQSDNLKRKDNIVLVVGTSGAGKSTLVNYLNNVELKGIFRDGKWKIDLADESKGLPGGFSIGHSTNTSETLYPGVYSPDGEDFSYVDCPGFGDSRGMNTDISNLFFREYITQNAKQIKILLVVSYSELTNPSGRNENLHNCLKDLSNFLGIFNDDRHLNELEDAIGLVVTGVADPIKSRIEELQERLQDKIKDIKKCISDIRGLETALDQSPALEGTLKPMIEQNKATKAGLEEKVNEINTLLRDLLQSGDNKSVQEIIKEKLTEFVETRSLPDSEKRILSHIVQNNRLKIFGNPETSGIVDSAEKEQIVSFIKEMRFLDKELAKVSVIAPQKYVGDLLQYTQSRFNGIKNIIKDYLIREVNSFTAKVINSAVNEDDVFEARERINELCRNGSEVKSLTRFLEELPEQIFKSEYKEQLYEDCSIIEFLINLLPNEYKASFGYEQEYSEGLGIIEDIKNLNKVLDEICKEPTFIYRNTGITCQGYFVKTSDIEIKINEYNDSECLSYLKIHALNSVIFDQSLVSEKLRGCNVVITAPKWNIVKSGIKINLSGLDQSGYPEGADKAPNGKGLEVDGKDGLVGLRGFNSGNFSGAGKEFFGERELKIVANGGRGGEGQNGGDGIEGVKGIAAKVTEVTRHSDFYMCRELKGVGSDEYYFKEGESGGKGGNAGRGGIGGKGGEGGKVYWGSVKDTVGSQVKIAVESREGEEGTAGAHGIVGKGGLYGDTAVRIYYKHELRNDTKDDKLPMIFEGWKGSYSNSSSRRASEGIIPDMRTRGSELEEDTRQPDGRGNVRAIDIVEELELYKIFCEQARETIERIAGTGIGLPIADFDLHDGYEIKELGSNSNMDYVESHG